MQQQRERPIYSSAASEVYKRKGMYADEAEDMLPETLNEMYGITENMREWEEENEEE